VSAHHDHGRAPEARLRFALLVTLATMGLELAGGALSGSLALLSDAGHMLADAGALALAVFAQRVAARPRSVRRTYGWRRAVTLAAFVDG
jgi:cobalt-zinc-cadmium efflux system protein